MNRRLSGLAVTGTFAGCVLLTCTSCASLNQTGQPTDRPSHSSLANARLRLAQFMFGREAAFGVCAEPACPQVTPKTLAVATSLTQPVALRDPPAQQPVALVVEEPPKPALAQAKADSAPPHMATHLVVVNFPFASAGLTPAARDALSASIGHARQSEKIVISGRTDIVGDAKANEALALSRSLAVRDYLRDLAPDIAATISIDAKGRCCYVAPNSDESGRSKNRRVEVLFTARGGT